MNIYFFALCRNLGNDVSFREDLMFYFQGEQYLYLVFFKNIFLLIVEFSHAKSSLLCIQKKMQHVGI